MKLHEAGKIAKRRTLPTTQAQFDAELAAAAREITGAGPGDREYDAIVLPPKRGRRANRAAEPMRLIAVRVPESLVVKLTRRARADHKTLSDEVRLAIAARAARAI